MTIEYTHFLINLSEEKGLNEKTIDSLLSSEDFHHLKYKLSCHATDIYNLVVYSSHEESFEKTRNELIKRMHEISEYISITNDSITKKYWGEIGSTIYELERSLRNLIELAFIKRNKMNWNELFTTSGNSRKEGRGAPFKYLNNFLDDLDFIDLTEFLKENITIINKAVQGEITSISEMILNIDSSSDLIQTKDDIIQKVRVLVSSNTKKINEHVSHSTYYSHLSPEIASEWRRLYVLRNFWAHNVHLISTEEFKEYIKISEKVKHSILVEQTLIGLFEGNDGEQAITLGSEKFKVVLHKTSFEGRGIIHLSGTFLDDKKEKNTFKKNNVTYQDVLKLYEEILNKSNEKELLEEMHAFFNNSILLKEEFNKLAEDIAEKFEVFYLNTTNGDKSNSINSYLIESGFQVDTKQTKVQTSEDIDGYLNNIFKYLEEEKKREEEQKKQNRKQKANQ